MIDFVQRTNDGFILSLINKTVTHETKEVTVELLTTKLCEVYEELIDSQVQVGRELSMISRLNREAIVAREIMNGSFIKKLKHIFFSPKYEFLDYGFGLDGRSVALKNKEGEGFKKIITY